MSIREIPLKIKGLLTSEFLLIGIVLMVGIVSFGLGRLSALGAVNEPILVQNGLVSATVTEGAEMTKNGQFVASRSGSAYHFPWCSGAQRIKEANKIWFESREEAERAGYKPAGNCKGL